MWNSLPRGEMDSCLRYERQAGTATAGTWLDFFAATDASGRQRQRGLSQQSGPMQRRCIMIGLNPVPCASGRDFHPRPITGELISGPKKKIIAAPPSLSVSDLSFQFGLDFFPLSSCLFTLPSFLSLVHIPCCCVEDGSSSRGRSDV